jgi:ATP-binding cassette subfamily B protein
MAHRRRLTVIAQFFEHAVALPLALSINWKLALLMTSLMFSFAVFNALAMRRTDVAQLHVERLHQEIAQQQIEEPLSSSRTA